MDFFSANGDYCIARIRYLATNPVTGASSFLYIPIDLAMYSQHGKEINQMNLPHIE